MKRSKFLACILMISIVSTFLSGCSTSSAEEETETVQTVQYNPYGFSASQFIEEGGYDEALKTVEENLLTLYCKTAGIAVDSDEYAELIQTTSATYDFENATLTAAVYARRSSAVDEEDTNPAYNWLDMSFKIDALAERYQDTAVTIRLNNITRTENKEYTCIDIEATIGSTNIKRTLKADIDENVPYVVNDGNTYEPLDYGVIYVCDQEGSGLNYVDISEYAEELEATRLNTWLIEHEAEQSLYFTTGSYESCVPENYTSDFDSEKIIADLNSFAKSFGLVIGDASEIPEKEKEFKKSDWEKLEYAYDSTETGSTAQEFFRTQIRNIYLSGTVYELVFNAEQLEDDENGNSQYKVTFYYRIYTESDATEE